jgi:hypothetical protein
VIFSHPVGKSLDALHASFTRLIDELNRFHPTISRLPVFADDTAAADGQLKVGDGYVTPDGFVKRRMA